jgi:hypothetical protein
MGDAEISFLVKKTVLKSQSFNPMTGEQLDDSEIIFLSSQELVNQQECLYLVDGFLNESGANPKPILYFRACIYMGDDGLMQSKLLDTVLFTPN